jgi:hypothetical protein
MPIIEGIPEGVNTSPFPQLQIQAGSGLDFPWAEYCPNAQGPSDCSFGSDGVGAGMVMVIKWPDLLTAVTQLLGYSYRDVPYTLSALVGSRSPAARLSPEKVRRVVALRGRRFVGRHGRRATPRLPPSSERPQYVQQQQANRPRTQA